MCILSFCGRNKFELALFREPANVTLSLLIFIKVGWVEASLKQKFMVLARMTGTFSPALKVSPFPYAPLLINVKFSTLIVSMTMS